MLYTLVQTTGAIKTNAPYSETKSPLNLQKTRLVYTVNRFYRNSPNIPSQISLAKQPVSANPFIQFTTAEIHNNSFFLTILKIWYNPHDTCSRLAHIPASERAGFLKILLLFAFKEVIYQKTQKVQNSTMCSFMHARSVNNPIHY